MLRAMTLTATLLIPGAASAQTMLEVPFFTGDFQEGWESHTTGQFTSCEVVSTAGDVCSSSVHITSGWSYTCQISPYSGSRLMGNTGGIQTYTFGSPMRSFGGYFSTNAGTNQDITFEFYDQAGTLVGSFTKPLNNCTWDWMGFSSSTDFYRVDVYRVDPSANTSYEAYVMVDDLEIGLGNLADLDQDGFETADGDCDDSDPDTYPGAPEICDNKDNDCDGSLGPDELDDDGDGFVECTGDCDDTDPDVNPDAPEICDGEDSNCDGNIDMDELDVDGDGYPICLDDCNDNDPGIFPGNPEIPDDGIDQDCDGSDEKTLVENEDEKPTDLGGCGCTTGPSAPWWGLTLLPLVLSRRR